MADTCYTPVVRLPKSKNSSSSTQSISNCQQDLQVEPKDMIVSETLHFDGLAGAISEMDLQNLLQAYPPLEIVIHQDGDSGYLRFSDAKTADRVYSLFNGFTFPNNSSKLQIQISSNDDDEHEPKGPILEVKGLPNGIDNDGLYDLFRPFGPLSLCKPIVIGRAFRGTAFVQYFFQAHSDEALDQLDGKSLDDGTTLSVAAFMPSKIRNTDYQQASKNSAASLAPPSSLDKSESYVDYMNLYIKNLEPHIDNDALFHLFRRFGHIVSARVMSNPVTGQSKGYGFVSYDKPEEAAAALHEMNGKIPPSCMKPLMVAFHEPKKPRQEKQHQQQHQQHLGTSPIPNALQPVQHQHQHQPFMSPIGAPVRVPPHAAEYASNAMSSMAGSTGISMTYDNRHPYDMTTTTTTANIPSQMNGLGIDNVDQIALNIKSIGQKRPSPPQQVHRKFSAAESNFGQHPLRLSPPFSTSPLSGVSSTGPSLASLASGINVQPRPPNMPVPQQQQQPDYRTANGRPTLRRKGSLESVSSIMTESSATVQRQRLVEAVMRCGDYAKSVNDIVDMLLTLKRKERSLCLFNQDFLREKIELALIALETFDEEERAQEEENDYAPNVPGVMETDTSPPMIKTTLPARVSKAIPIVAPPPESPTNKKSTSPSSQQQSTRTTSATNGSSTTTTTTTNNTTTTTSNNNNNDTADIEVLLASLEGKPVHEKKQQLGDRLFPLVKATGTKQAPKVTIRLLDSIDLHELAHLMYDKNKLKERVEVAFASLK
ncbi:hypothetical protein LRAMOSA10660 [Lichtheimia ramosa]|uniref:Uncharacterized protein n=1 Tax=Lichtheimia ramosa TaxID=688394 RepID=A0A077WPG2_9FUNG|nr:hypothetical protein LRAMOSA10660 [Lichtheimia ramosa]